jgi:formate dehydrogenase assembly factor FdhD
MTENIINIRNQSVDDESVYLVTGELVSFAANKQLAMGYVIAENAVQAVEEQIKIQPNLRVSGVVSLAELKKQVEILEAARDGKHPTLRCGKHKQSV